jgi:serine/threonine-protein kinase ATR
VSAAEFLLPLLVLESVCFGDADDEQVVLQEIRDVLCVEQYLGCMDKPDRQRAVDVIFMVIDTLNYWSVHETEARYRTSREAPGPSKLDDEPSLSNWSAESSVLRIEDVMRAIPLSIQAKAAAEAGMHARSLRILEMETRLLVVDRVFNASTDEEQIDMANGDENALSMIDRSLMKDVLGKLNDSDALIVIAREALCVDSNERARDSIRQKEATGDWLGALLEYERAQQLDGPDRRDGRLQQGALRCLMELGQFESVLNQVTHAARPTDLGDDSTTRNLIPLAIEAAWRLGRWSALADLVTLHSDFYRDNEDNENSFQVALGEAMLGLHSKSYEVVRKALVEARHAAMKDLSSVAKESYDRSYSHVVKLHCLREIENASEVLCKEKHGQHFEKLSYVAESKSRDGWDWERRLKILSNDGVAAVINTRLALARFSRDDELEGSLFLNLGKKARKSGLLSMAANSFAQAEAIFDRLNIKNALSSVRMQLAKLKYETGDITAALKMLGQDGKIKSQGPGQTMSVFDATECGRLSASAQTDFGDVRCILQSTRWMIDGGLKGSGEIMRRLRAIQKHSPEWEKGKALGVT